MKDYGLVSIITPTYNCGRFIAETIDSVLSQSYGDWEMLIVDDCSTDNTKEIVDRYCAKDSRIKYCCLERNSGAAVARNRALRMAKGRWIAFLDSDDLWTPDKLEKQLDFMVSNDYSFSYHEYTEIDEDSNPIPSKITGPKHIGKIGMYCYCWPGCLTVMYNFKKIGDIQINPIAKNNDYAIWLNAIEKADCHYMDAQCGFYRKRTGSISHHGYVALIKWHYRLFNQSLGMNKFASVILTCNNLFFGVIKKVFYVKSSN